MKHQEFKNRDAYARRYGELVVENVAPLSTCSKKKGFTLVKNTDKKD